MREMKISKFSNYHFLHFVTSLSLIRFKYFFTHKFNCSLFFLSFNCTEHGAVTTRFQ